MLLFSIYSITIYIHVLSVWISNNSVLIVVLYVYICILFCYCDVFIDRTR